MTMQTAGLTNARATVGRRLRRLAHIEARLGETRALYEREAAAVRDRYEGRIQALQDLVDRQLQMLEDFCRRQRDLILPQGRRSLKMPCGQVGFRRTEPSVQAVPGMTDDRACDLLSARGLDGLVRAIRRPDKPAVRRALREGLVSPSGLEECGLLIVEGQDSFQCKVWQTGLAASVGGSR